MEKKTLYIKDVKEDEVYLVINGMWKFRVIDKDESFVTISYVSPSGHNIEKVPIDNRDLRLELQ